MSEVSSIPHSNHDDHHHHKETFITKYIFSQDHKMIAKQYLILGVYLWVLLVWLCLYYLDFN